MIKRYTFLILLWFAALTWLRAQTTGSITFQGTTFNYSYTLIPPANCQGLGTVQNLTVTKSGGDPDQFGTDMAFISSSDFNFDIPPFTFGETITVSDLAVGSYSVSIPNIFSTNLDSAHIFIPIPVAPAGSAGVPFVPEVAHGFQNIRLTCPGSSLTLHASGCSTDYIWENGLGNSSTMSSTTGSSIVVTPADEAGLHYTVRCKDGCPEAIFYFQVGTLPSGDPLCGPNPVKLVSFRASREEEGIRIKWQTAEEVGFKHFEIEKSSNATSFIKLGTIEGRGTTSSISTYDFLDPKPSQGIAYYRLKMVDLDGKVEFSKIISVSWDKLLNENGIDISLYPNPISSNEGSLYLFVDAEVLKVSTTTISSERQNVISHQKIGGDHRLYVLDISALQSGKYFLVLETDKGKFSKQFIKY